MSGISLERELEIRQAAMKWLDEQKQLGHEWFKQSELMQFTFQGERISLKDGQKGIRKPASFDAALSICTVYTPEGGLRPYEDVLGGDGFLRYNWRGTDPFLADNVALRRARELQVPLIWFRGINSHADYAAVYPVYLVDEEPANHRFVVALDTSPIQFAQLISGLQLDLRVGDLRAYRESQTNVRMHQPMFRAAVMRAYDAECAVCSFKHSPLLDAAHIVADSAGGQPVVTNGLSLCKIHHAAFDEKIIGITPDYRVQVKEKVLAETDGPMLRYGIQQHHGMRLMKVPTHKEDRPDPTLLQLKFEEFLAV